MHHIGGDRGAVGVGHGIACDATSVTVKTMLRNNAAQLAAPDSR